MVRFLSCEADRQQVAGSEALRGFALVTVAVAMPSLNRSLPNRVCRLLVTISGENARLSQTTRADKPLTRCRVVPRSALFLLL